MPRRTKPTAESPASSDTPGDAHRLAELIDLQHRLLLGFATGTIDMAAASGAFDEAQEEIRAICGRLGAIRPPFPWGNLEAWKWEAKGFDDAADIDARLGQYRSQVDAAIAVLTGEPRWTLYPFADDQAAFSRDLADLDAPKLDALQVALEEVLAIHGNALIGTKWIHKVVDGDGVYEFRVDNDEDQIRARTGATEPAGADDIEVDVLIRVFFVFDGRRAILLLSAYDKGEDDSNTRQTREIAEAKRRATRYRARR